MGFIYVDIETLPAVHWTEAERREYVRNKVPGNISKEETIAKWVDENGEETFARTSLDWRHGRIFCVAYAVDDDPVQCVVSENGNPDEEELLSRLYTGMLAATRRPMASGYTWVGHNLSFDLTWLHHHSLRHRLTPMARVIPWDKWLKGCDDTAAMWAGPDYRSMTKLVDVAEFLGLGSKTEGMDGSEVYPAWKRGDYELIATYCKQDVELTRAVHKRLRFREE